MNKLDKKIKRLLKYFNKIELTGYEIPFFWINDNAYQINIKRVEDKSNG